MFYTLLSATNFAAPVRKFCCELLLFQQVLSVVFSIQAEWWFRHASGGLMLPVVSERHFWSITTWEKFKVRLIRSSNTSNFFGLPRSSKFICNKICCQEKYDTLGELKRTVIKGSWLRLGQLLWRLNKREVVSGDWQIPATSLVRIKRGRTVGQFPTVLQIICSSGRFPLTFYFTKRVMNGNTCFGYKYCLEPS